uniref:Uncharacterized protein n=1 Tax=Arundo donax TaxID=35708 RepID=A0A0A8XYJ4_ARUDO
MYTTSSQCRCPLASANTTNPIQSSVSVCSCIRQHRSKLACHCNSDRVGVQDKTAGGVNGAQYSGTMASESTPASP